MTYVLPGVAMTGHAYALLEYIKRETFEKEFLTKWFFDNSHDKIARFVCYDQELVNIQEAIEIANYIHKKQIELTRESFISVLNKFDKNHENDNIKIVALGLGTNIITKKMVKTLDVDLIDLNSLNVLLNKNIKSALGTAIIGWEHIYQKYIHLDQIKNTQILEEEVNG